METLDGLKVIVSDRLGGEAAFRSGDTLYLSPAAYARLLVPGEPPERPPEERKLRDEAFQKATSEMLCNLSRLGL